MDMTNQEYQQYVASKAQKSPIVKNTLWAFAVGGLICTAGQGLLNLYQYYGLDKQDASAGVTVSLIFLSALLTGLKVYDKIAKFAGAGTLVPVTGFANSIVSPALEFKSEGFILGMSAKMFVIAGPVLVFGISASVIYGLLLLLFT
ncbi:stage V sporulation protein AC [Papillibacter cinnamivorans]|uniref:Stage V sporulation protein AC n=1 Tax=Papillibacter cinnamivorans DSM 12816 TaxID=1122930 RepID=A0A1W2A6Q8_9FIRM|nr:stage V sporulation protein AC [Papillibacter cinnamivorans]SMC56263.1 stage V sporulation protein AC [Papillibacter cinnamivorans DSM 12816]